MPCARASAEVPAEVTAMPCARASAEVPESRRLRRARFSLRRLLGLPSHAGSLAKMRLFFFRYCAHGIALASRLLRRLLSASPTQRVPSIQFDRLSADTIYNYD
jgi:hypothetical protein